MRRGHVGFRPYVVGMLDVLGQKEELERLDKTLWPSRAPRALSYDEARPLCRVLWLREFIRLTMAKLLKKTSGDVEHEGTAYFHMQQFSDTVIFFAENPPNDHQHFVPAHAYAVLMTFSKTVLNALGRHIPLRGSIEYGYAAELGNGDLYGPVIAYTHWLEDEIAQHPRVVIGYRLAELLSTTSLDEVEGLRAATKKQELDLCASMIRQETDRVPFLDFLGGTVHALLANVEVVNGINASEAVAKGFEFACEESARFQAEGNEKLALRYALLKDYYLSRLPLWGIDPESCLSETPGSS